MAEHHFTNDGGPQAMQGIHDGVETAVAIGGAVTLTLRCAGPAERAALERQLLPSPPAPWDAAADVIVEADPTVPGTLVDLQRNAGDGRLTATDGERFCVLEQGHACVIPALGAEGPARFAYEPGFPIARAFGRLVRPALQVALPARGAVAAHAAAVEIHGRAVLVAGWSESGKTETALALMERGARFLSDKWTVLRADGTAAVFPIGVGVRGWVLEHLPRLDGAVRGRDRGRLRAAGWVRAAARPLDGGAAGSRLERAIALADRISVTPPRLRELYGDDPRAPWEAPLGAVALLTTIPAGAGVRVQPADARWAAERLARTAAFERRGIFELHDRASWGLRDRDGDARRSLVEAERVLLERVLSDVTVLDVRAPFPTDPRPVAEAIAASL
jgi:hypothetical protein